MLPKVSFENFLPAPATVPYGLCKSDVTPCLADVHLNLDQENQNVEWPKLG